MDERRVITQNWLLQKTPLVYQLADRRLHEDLDERFFLSVTYRIGGFLKKIRFSCLFVCFFRTKYCKLVKILHSSRGYQLK